MFLCRLRRQQELAFGQPFLPLPTEDRQSPERDCMGGKLRLIAKFPSGDGPLAAGVVKLLLDGQQRMTSLYGVIRGKPPQFFDGNATAFTGLRFHLDTETFGFYQPLKTQGDPQWIDMTELMQRGNAGYGLAGRTRSHEAVPHNCQTCAEGDTGTPTTHPQEPTSMTSILCHPRISQHASPLPLVAEKCQVIVRFLAISFAILWAGVLLGKSAHLRLYPIDLRLL
jgi:hypothetical protein